MANGQLTFVDGLLALRYPSSQPCGGSTGTATRSTVVNFVCGSEEGESAPAYVGSTDDCTYYVSWHTALACETQAGTPAAAFTDLLIRRVFVTCEEFVSRAR